MHLAANIWQECGPLFCFFLHNLHTFNSNKCLVSIGILRSFFWSSKLCLELKALILKCIKDDIYIPEKLSNYTFFNNIYTLTAFYNYDCIVVIASVRQPIEKRSYISKREFIFHFEERRTRFLADAPNVTQVPFRSLSKSLAHLVRALFEWREFYRSV